MFNLLDEQRDHGLREKDNDTLGRGFYNMALS
jgi:hypothetical protein